MRMNVFRKMSAALVAIASLTAGNDAMAACSKSLQVAWWSGGSQHHWFSCRQPSGSNVILAYFYLNSTTSGNYGTVNLQNGTAAQISGKTQSGGWVSGCSADDFSGGGNSPVYLNWNGSGNIGFSHPSCSQAFLARLYAETFNN
jgi:hypothetical protein